MKKNVRKLLVNNLDEILKQLKVPVTGNIVYKSV